MIERKWFSQQEAEEKVGKRIRTLVAWSGVEEGTTGQVTRVDPAAGDIKDEQGQTVKGFNVAIKWERPGEAPVVDLIIPAGAEPYLFVRTGKPLVDWFTKGEYERYLEELEND